MTPEAMAYLREALDYIQENSIKREQIDWLSLKQEIFAITKDAQTPADTHLAIELVLQRLGDNHSFFISPAQRQQRLTGMIRRAGIRVTYPEGFVVVVFAGSPAEQAAIQVGDRIVLLNGVAPYTLTSQQFQQALREEQVELVLQSREQASSRTVHLQTAPYDERRLPQGWRLSDTVGYLDLPDLPNSPEHKQLYIAQAQQLLRDIDEQPIYGWILDLRRNFGGNMWPMLVGVGTLLGEGEWLVFRSPWRQEVAFYRDGKAGTDRRGVVAECKTPYQLKRAWPPVAVLIGPMTASSGEFVALAFRGRPRTRSFGEPTYGLPTSNYSKELSDGAVVALTTSLGVDRTGQTFDSPIPPDHLIKTDWTRLGTQDDPVLQVALEWLEIEDHLQHE